MKRYIGFDWLLRLLKAGLGTVPICGTVIQLESKTGDWATAHSYFDHGLQTKLFISCSQESCLINCAGSCE